MTTDPDGKPYRHNAEQAEAAKRGRMVLPTTQPTHADIAWYAREVVELLAENDRLTTENNTVYAALNDSVGHLVYAAAIARAERAEAKLHDVSLDLSTANHMIKLERDRADALQTRLNEIESALRKFNLID